MSKPIEEDNKSDDSTKSYYFMKKDKVRDMIEKLSHIDFKLYQD